MTDYIPTYEEAKNWYAHEAETLELEFDRWLRKVKADTLREALAQGPKKYYPLDLHGHMGAAIPVGWLEDEAARIERGL